MDEVDAMARAGESVGKAVGTGLRAVRRGAVRAGHAGADAAVTWAERAEGKLAERGVTAEHVRGVVADRAGALVEKAEEVEKSTRKSRKRLAKKAKGVRKDVAKVADRARKETRIRAKDVRKAAKQARKDFAAAQRPKKSRKWPWLLGLVAAVAVAGYVALTRRPEEVHLEEVDEQVEPPVTDRTSTDRTTADRTTAEHAARNGRPADQGVSDRH
ncbi:hypothetical protein ABZ816_33225 [Actinosynnema sp. NPDC047251]|nr:hypothetical protein [Saccharothrix espanaensis]